MKPELLYITKLRFLGDKHPRRITFEHYLRETEEKVEEIKAVRKGKAEKTDLPAIIPAGIFRGGYQYENLKRTTGFASFDIDKPEDMEATKAVLRGLNWVYFFAESASGKGIWGLVKFKSPSQYVFHYGALLKEFEKHGIQIDPTGANINRLRFYSYDPDYYLNIEPRIFDKMEIGVFRTKNGQQIDWKVEYNHRFKSREWMIIRQFNRNYFCEDLFESAGWQVLRSNSRGQIPILRPGSDKTQSGNILKNKAWIFTSSTHFPQNSLNGPFDCYTHLFHEGNPRKALREIRLNKMV